MVRTLRDGAGYRQGHAIQAQREAVNVDYPIGQLCQSVGDLQVMYEALNTLEVITDAAGRVC